MVQVRLFFCEKKEQQSSAERSAFWLFAGSGASAPHCLACMSPGSGVEVPALLALAFELALAEP